MRSRFASFTALSTLLGVLVALGAARCYEEKLPVSAKNAPAPPPPAKEVASVASTQPLPLPSKVAMETSLGRIVVELNAEKAPITVENFVKYVDDKFYDGTIFHRVAKSPAVIQGGGFDANKQQKRTRAPIKNEAQNGLSNARGTIAMARQNPPHTATAQFYINTQDNKFLDHPGQTGWGYCVFGRVVEGMDVVDKIAGVATGAGQGKLLNGDSSLESTPYVDAPLGDCPVENVVITSVSRLP